MEAGESAQSVQPIIDAEPESVTRFHAVCAILTSHDRRSSAQHQGDTTNNPGVPETLPTEST